MLLKCNQSWEILILPSVITRKQKSFSLQLNQHFFSQAMKQLRKAKKKSKIILSLLGNVRIGRKTGRVLSSLFLNNSCWKLCSALKLLTANISYAWQFIYNLKLFLTVTGIIDEL